MSNDKTVDGRYVAQAAMRGVFLNVMTPKAVGRKGKAKGDPKFSGSFVEISEADVKGMKAKAAEVAKARWPGRDLKELKFPFTLGDRKIEREAKAAEREGRKPRDQAFFKGQIVLDARSKYEPQLAVLKNGKVEAYTGDKRALAKEFFYNGAYVVPSLNFVAYEGQAEDGVGNPDGVTAYLDMLLFIKHGPKIGGVDPTEVFKGYAGTTTNTDPGSDPDDEIPF